MATHKVVYRWSQDYAKRYDELDQWRESYKENCTCARAIEKVINENYQDNRLNTDTAQGIIAEYGWNRVQWVLANTVQQHADDGRFSPENKKWAEGFYMPEDDNLWHYSVEAHPGLVNMFVDRVQKEWQALGLFDRTHCTDEGDYEDKLIVLKPSSLKDQYKTPEFQLFYATSGFGCDPKKICTQVAGHFLKDDEYAHFRRADFIGVIREDCIPEWAQEKLKQYQEPVEQTDIKME